jgi:hypothetical protein
MQGLARVSCLYFLVGGGVFVGGGILVGGGIIVGGGIGLGGTWIRSGRLGS